MKTTLTIIIAAIALAISACGGSDTTTTVQAPAPEAATTTTAPEPSLPTGWTESGYQDWLNICGGKSSESECACVAQELGNQGVTDADIYASPDPSREFRSETAHAALACSAPSY